MHANGVYKACERNIISATKNHDTSSYNCREQIFTHELLVRASEEACVRMNTLARYNYPANYNGPEFAKEGPYLTYPVFREGLFKYSKLLLNILIINLLNDTS